MAVEYENDGTRQDGSIELEGWVLGGRANERDGAVLHVRQEAVLLGAIEAMDLVDEEQCAPALLAPELGALEHLAQVLDTGENRGDLFEL
jgi:hypothetical protein